MATNSFLSTTSASKPVNVLLICGFLALCLIAGFGLISQRTMDSHECFVSVTAREMVQNNNWVFPTMNGQPRLNKTPLQYWLVASMSCITGQIDEFTARFPSAVFGFFSAICLYLYVKKWLGFRAGLMCAGVWITTLCFMRHSRNARPEMGLTFFILICYLSFWDALNSPTHRNQLIAMLIFWVSLSLGMLQKGPAPVMYVFVPLFVYFITLTFYQKPLWRWMCVFWICLGIIVLVNQTIIRAAAAIPVLWIACIVVYRQRHIITKLLPILGPILFLLILLPWPLFIGHKIHWDLSLWQKEYVDRLSGDYAGGHYPIYFYVLMIFKFIFPWVVFVPMAFITPFDRKWKNKQPLLLYLWVIFIAVFVFLTIDQGKRQHYILPIMPILAIMIGIVLEDMIFIRDVVSVKLARETLRYHALILAGGAVIGAGVVNFLYPSFQFRAIELAIVVVLLVGGTLVLFRRGKLVFAAGLVFAGIVGCNLLSRLLFTKDFDEDRYARNIALEIAARVPADRRLLAYQYVSSRFVQYYGKIIPVIRDQNAVKNAYEHGDWIYCDLENLDKFKALQDVNEFSEAYSETDIPGHIRKGDYGGVLFRRKDVPKTE